MAVLEGPKSEATPHDEAVKISPPGLRGPPTSRSPPLTSPREPVSARTYSFARRPRAPAKSARSAAAVKTSGTNGGFISNDPRVGANWKKDPRDPNGPSTSGNAEQKRP